MLKAHVAGKIGIPTGAGIRFYLPQEIAFLKALSNYTEVHICSGESHLLSKTMKVVVKQLPEENFLRVHKSFVVNVGFIREVRIAASKCHIELDNGILIPVSRRMKRKIM
jgi:DNA-binding LytR/AlgR family response regulator